MCGTSPEGCQPTFQTALSAPRPLARLAKVSCPGARGSGGRHRGVSVYTGRGTPWMRGGWFTIPGGLPLRPPGGLGMGDNERRHNFRQIPVPAVLALFEKVRSGCSQLDSLQGLNVS